MTERGRKGKRKKEYDREREMHERKSNIVGLFSRAYRIAELEFCRKLSIQFKFRCSQPNVCAWMVNLCVCCSIREI